jgi:hypothetical protein
MSPIEGAIQHTSSILRTSLRRLVQDRDVVIIGGSVAISDALIQSGADTVTRIEVPVDRSLPVAEYMRQVDAILASPSSVLARSLDAIDPKGQALIYAGSFTRQQVCCGRRIIGSRRAKWFDAENKESQVRYTTKQAGLQQTWIAANSPEEMIRITKTWCASSPTVVSGAPRRFLAMGASHTFLFSGPLSPDVGEGIIRQMCNSCRGIRLSRFTEGIPATFYGFVAAGHLFNIGPVEALSYVEKGSLRIAATGIQVPCQINSAMRKNAAIAIKSTIDALITDVDYKGAFGVDGVLTHKEYVIHEINPRICAGFSWINRATGGTIPMGLIDLILREDLVDSHADLFRSLRIIGSHLERHLDLKLWNRPNVETELLNLRPKVDSQRTLTQWQRQVRDAVTPTDAISLYRWSPGHLGRW